MQTNVEFDKLIEAAEEYIMKKAGKILKLIREKDKDISCHDLISEKYKPMIENLESLSDKELFELVLKRFCIELQNYQAMPKAIKYADYDYVSKSRDLKNIKRNSICDIVKEFYDNGAKKEDYSSGKIYNKMRDKLKFEEKKKIKDSIKEELIASGINISTINNNEVYNYAWERYCRGLADVINYLKNEDGLKKIRNILENANKNYDKKMFKNKIYYMGEALTDNFFKELGAKGLIKADVHIREIFKEALGIYSNIDKNFEELCKESKKGSAYYIDKILWLCSTGNFYEDGITINSMTRQNFINYFKG